MNRQFQEEETQIVNKYMKNCLPCQLTREIPMRDKICPCGIDKNREVTSTANKNVEKGVL